MRKNEARPASLEVDHDASITWRYLAPNGHTLEQCADPRYWDNLHRELGQQRIAGRHAWNKLEIVAEDGSWEAMFRVLSVGADGVRLRLIYKTEPVATATEVPEGYRVEYVENNGWRTIDFKNRRIAEKLSTKDEAVRVAIDHAKKAAA